MIFQKFLLQPKFFSSWATMQLRISQMWLPLMCLPHFFYYYPSWARPYLVWATFPKVVINNWITDLLQSQHRIYIYISKVTNSPYFTLFFTWLLQRSPSSANDGDFEKNPSSPLLSSINCIRQGLLRRTFRWYAPSPKSPFFWRSFPHVLLILLVEFSSVKGF